MRRTARIYVALTTAFFTLDATAAYITDKLLAGFYAEPVAQGQPLRVLQSGTPLEILERKGELTQVRLTDNSEGWIQSEYITDEKPAQVMLLEAQARAGALEQELAKTKAQLAQAQQALEAVAQPQTPDVQPGAMAPPASSVPADSPPVQRPTPLSLALALGLVFIAGLAGGVALFNYRFRKRFGGLRL